MSCKKVEHKKKYNHKLAVEKYCFGNRKKYYERITKISLKKRNIYVFYVPQNFSVMKVLEKKELIF